MQRKRRGKEKGDGGEGRRRGKRRASVPISRLCPIGFTNSIAKFTLDCTLAKLRIYKFTTTEVGDVRSNVNCLKLIKKTVNTLQV